MTDPRSCIGCHKLRYHGFFGYGFLSCNGIALGDGEPKEINHGCFEAINTNQMSTEKENLNG